MVYYGLQLLNPNYFYVTTAAICALVSFGIGSSWTVVGTIGIGLMGISSNMGLDPAITAAAIISGAYFGDTTSPLSDLANLAAGAANADLYDHIRETSLISILALLLSLAVFWFFSGTASFDASAKMAAINKAFHISPALFVPLILVVGLALLKIPPFTTIFIGALAGGVLAVIVAPDRVIAFANTDDFGAGMAWPGQGCMARPCQWLCVDIRRSDHRHARNARRHEQHARHDLACDYGFRLRWGCREDRYFGKTDRSDHRCGKNRREPDCRPRRRRGRNQRRDC